MAKQQQWLRSARHLVFSRRGIAIFKGSLAYTMAFVIIFLRGFDNLNKYPAALASMMIVVIAGGPGKAFGAVVTGTILAALGIGVGALNFFILAKLAPWTIAQAVYFFFAVYVIAYVKGLGLKWFGPTILAILMSFNGIYTSILRGNHFDKNYLGAYFTAYLWGGAINIFIAIFIFPISSEKELRQLMLQSLQHIETFGMLISRSYLMIITEEERAIRDGLSQSIRADFGFLMQKLEETTIEVNWSKWSLADYQFFIAKIRAMQLALISNHSSLTNIEKNEDELYRKAFVPKTLGPFNRLRLDLRLTLRGIQAAFGQKDLDLPKCAWESYMDVERLVAESEGPSRGRSNSVRSAASGDMVRLADIRAVADRLAAEFEHGTQADGITADPQDNLSDNSSTSDSPNARSKVQGNTQSPVATTYVNTPETAQVAEKRLDEEEQKEAAKILSERGPQSLLADLDIFNQTQHDMITTALTSGTFTDCSSKIKLRVHAPQPSVMDLYGLDFIRGQQEDKAQTSQQAESSAIRQRQVRVREAHTEDARTTVPLTDDEPRPQSSTVEKVIAGDHSLIRVYSMLFAMTQYARLMSAFHDRVTQRDAKGRLPRKRLHFHFFESLRPATTPAATNAYSDDGVNDLSLPEALAILEGKTWQPKSTTMWKQIGKVKTWFLGANSLYALKTAAATTVFAILIYAHTTRAWFISYNLTGGLITIVVALAPTLGQSAVTFLLQIAGSSIGYVFALFLLTIFHNVGGFVYNPYGICVLVFLYSIPMQYLIYENPKFFALALLGLNATGVLVVTEWVYREYYGRNFDSPALRTGKALAALAVGLGIVTVFQLFVARNPARRSLRLALADITRSNLAYLTLLQAYVRAVIPADPGHQVPQAAIQRVYDELKTREIKIQGSIIAVMPLLTFAAAEPSFSSHFSAKPFIKIIRANQVILDRLREGRDAVGTTGFDDIFLSEFVAPLSPYRRRSSKLSKTCLAMVSSSLAAKMPLPGDVGAGEFHNMLPDFMHDALVLSHRFAKTEEGKQALKSGEFTRYWFYVLGVTSIFPHMLDIQDVCLSLYGRLEDSLN